jgi:hypothetical protein
MAAAEPDVRLRKVMVQRTCKLAVAKSVNAGKREKLEGTDGLFREMVRWYADIVLAHSGCVNPIWPHLLL